MMIYIKIGLFSMLLTLLVGNGYSQEVVEKYEFFGNERVDDDQLQTWSGLKEGFAVNLSIINAANQKIITGYQEAGYLYARIDSTVLTGEDKKKGSTVQWYINEGALVRLGKVRMVADSLSIEDLENLVDFNEGDIYRREYIESELAVIGQFYAESGYPLATIDITNTSLRSEEDIKYIDIEIKINSGPGITINKIIIRGNQSTQDEVILRE
ncbi:MAG: hypothetical protein KAS58_07215, partial [Calditrichia bacterium]|nr:hypothetical protein [Calditrichia bacterium]